MQEALYPYRFDAYMLRLDSAGAGHTRGGLGTIKAYRFLSPCTLTVNFDRTKCLPWGLQGGHEAQGGHVEFVRADGTTEILFKGTRSANVGDKICVYAGGGGGFGPPKLRDANRVAYDVREGYISRAAAVSQYGVALNEALEPDMAATETIRNNRP
jgi:N-methylhydantoinase B